MRDKIRENIEASVQARIREALEKNDPSTLSLERLSKLIANDVVAKLPHFTQERKRDFDDPHDSFSTEIYERWVTDWR